MTQDVIALVIFVFTFGIGILMSLHLNKKTFRKKTVEKKQEIKRSFRIINGGKNE